jgi:hypothetical protein
MASIFSKVPKDTMRSVKKAFSYLTLVTKLRCEKRVYLNSFNPELDEGRMSSLLPVTFQGFAFINRGLKIESSKFSDLRFPSIKSLNNEVIQLLSEKHDPSLVQDIEKLERKYFDLFLSELEKVNMFSNTAALFEKCFSIV